MLTKTLLQILRLLNTNVDGKQKVMYALTKIKGVGRRYSNLVCKKADVDLNKRYEFLRPSPTSTPPTTFSSLMTLSCTSHISLPHPPPLSSFLFFFSSPPLQTADVEFLL